jgi:D-lactate dehydrogenase
MRVLIYSARSYDRQALTDANRDRHELVFSKTALNEQTAVLAQGFPAVCGFVDDNFGPAVLRQLAQGGTRLVLLRATGFNNVDLPAAHELGITVMRVMEYSPYSVAEFAVCMILALNRKIHRAYNKVRESNFLLDGLLGFDLHGKTVGVVGTGKIGRVFAGIMQGFGCKLLGHDPQPHPECSERGMRYVALPELLAGSDIVSLHVPLMPATHYLINAETLDLMKPGAMLINTSRGGLVNTRALIRALKTGHLGAVGLDVYEEESHMYFHDLSNDIVPDDVFTRLLTFPNVLVTGHQGFFTREALADIAATTIGNLDDFAAGRSNPNVLKAAEVVRPTPA